MSTEQPPAPPATPTPTPNQPAATQQPQQPHQPQPAKSEPNALAQWLSTAWTKFKSGQLIGYPMMALILVLIAGVGVGWWIMSERKKAQAALWIELSEARTVEDLEKYVKDHSGTLQAKFASLEIAREHLGPQGIDRMTTRDTGSLEEVAKANETRTAAVANVEKAREEFTKLADDFKDDPVARVQCLYGAAKAEAVLVGIPKPGKQSNPLGQLEPGDSRGDSKKAVELLDKLAEAAPDTDWGKDAKKLADVLRNQNTEQQVRTLQDSLFNLSPTLPKFPNMPKDAIHGFPGP